METGDVQLPEPAEASGSRLNTLIAITVALLATFLGICKVKDDNIVQAMQQRQIDRLDHWSFYQARNIRQEIAQAQVIQLQSLRETQRAGTRAPIDSAIARYAALARDQAVKKDSLRLEALNDERVYEALNYRDDQFDLSDTLIAIAISMLAIASLTRKRWMYFVALIPTALGVLMGLAGLAGWHIHPDSLAALLS